MKLILWTVTKLMESFQLKGIHKIAAFRGEDKEIYGPEEGLITGNLYKQKLSILDEIERDRFWYDFFSNPSADEQRKKASIYFEKNVLRYECF